MGLGIHIIQQWLNTVHGRGCTESRKQQDQI